MNDYPYPYGNQSNRLEILQQVIEEKEWWEKFEKSLKKEEKKDDTAKKGPMQQGLSMIQTTLLLIGLSPFIAILYKVAIIPALIR